MPILLSAGIFMTANAHAATTFRWRHLDSSPRWNERCSTERATDRHVGNDEQIKSPSPEATS